jgi:perosamine synthetase
MSILAINGGPKAVDEARLTSGLKWHAKYPVIDEEYDVASVLEVLRSRQLSLPGRVGVVAELEDALARYYDVPYTLTFNCGTAALHSAYLAAGVGPGTEVVTSPYTWVTNVTAILAAGGIPVFADIDPDSLNINAKTIAPQVTPYTRAISVTHLYGHPAEMDEIMRLASEKNLTVIEDASQAHGAEYRGRKVGTIGHIGCFSMQAGKQIVAGEGGFIVTREHDLYERAILFGHHPARLKQSITTSQLKPFAATGLGFKYRIPALSAALANAQLARLDLWNASRRRNAEHFTQNLAGIRGMRPLKIADHVIHTFYMYALRYIPEELGNLPRQQFIEAVNAEGVPLLSNYCEPIYFAPLFQMRRYPDRRSPWEDPEVKRDVMYTRGACPVAERHAETELLIYFPRFTENCPLLMEAFAAGIRKVSEHVDELHTSERLQPLSK